MGTHRVVITRREASQESAVTPSGRGARVKTTGVPVVSEASSVEHNRPSRWGGPFLVPDAPTGC